MLKNAPTLAIVAVDTAENEPFSLLISSQQCSEIRTSLIELALIGEGGQKEEECDHGFTGNPTDESK